MRSRFTLAFVGAFTVMLFVALTAIARGSQSVAPYQSAATDFVKGEVLLRLRPGTTLSTASRSSLLSNSTTLSERLSQVTARMAISVFAGTQDSDLQRIYRVQIDPQMDVQAVAKHLAADPDVEYAEPNFLAHAAVVPNDPLYASQWALDKINAPAAWNVATGVPSVVVALIDSGIDTTHPDVAGKLWVNPGEIPGNGIDDDNNGYVDDVNGWNFVGNNNNVADDNGHGTQVAGVAGALTNNAIGIAGLCWNCRLMIVKAMQASGVANYSDIAAAVNYAASKGAQVINLSLGGYADSATLRAAIDAASTTAVIVGGAGNNNVSAPFYPAAYSNVLAVASTTSSDTKASFSDYGPWVDVAAPGVAISTTFSGGDYGTSDGTSLSAPLVSGLAGLVKSAHPGWSPALVRAQIVHTTHAITETQLGSGRINAASAITTSPVSIIQVVDYSVGGQINGALKTGLTNMLAVTLHNDWLDASSVTATLSTTSTDVVVMKANASYGAIGAGQSSANTADLFQVSVTAAAYGRIIPFTLAVNADGQVSTLVLTTTTESVVVTVGGTISSGTIWTNDRIYQATSNVIVNTGVTLTIQPGTMVKFNQGVALLVNGTLIADGTPASPIRFTSALASPTPGAWGNAVVLGIAFSSSSQPAQYDVNGNYLQGSIIRHAIVEYSFGIAIQGGAPSIDHNLIWKNNAAVFIDGSSAFPIVISHNRILDNTGGTIYGRSNGPLLIRQNLVANNSGSLSLNSSTYTVISNTITGNLADNRGVISIESPVNQFSGNNIYRNLGVYDVMAFISSGQVATATFNYWGTTDQPTIQSRIYDFIQDPSRGTVSFVPFLTQPESTAPPFLYQMSIGPTSPIGIQQATFTVTFSAPMDQSTNPVVTFGASAPYTTSTVVDNAQWLSDRVWRATYDITSLIPRGTYTLSVSGVNGLDGMPIPTDTRFGFTVDYAGGVVDTTPPPAPSVLVDICRNSTTSVAASWFASDPQSAITLYRYALGSSASSVDVFNWTDTGSTSVTRTGLNLVAGQRYYFSVKARNAGGLWSSSTSAGFTAGLPCQKVYLPLIRK